MRFERQFTTAGTHPYNDVPFRMASSEIRNPDGTVVFSAENIEVPEQFSQVATDILAQKYFRKAGVPAALKRIDDLLGKKLALLDLPKSVQVESTPRWEAHAMARAIDREKRKADPTFKGAFHEKKRKPSPQGKQRSRRRKR